MSLAVQLAAPVVATFTVVGSFALLRRASRSNRLPRWLDNDPMGYVIAMLFTIAFCISGVIGLYGFTKVMPSVMVAFCAVVAFHIAVWSLMRVLIPIAQDAKQPAPALPASAAPVH